MIAICNSCNLRFTSQMFGNLTNISNGTFYNNTERCPSCGSLAKVIEGTFNFDSQGNATLINGPKLSYEILQELNELVLHAQKYGTSKDEFLNEAKKITKDSSISHLFTRENYRDIKDLILFVIGIITFYQVFIKKNPVTPISNYSSNITINNALPKNEIKTSGPRFTPKKKKRKIKR